MKCRFCESDKNQIKRIQSPWVDYEYTLHQCYDCRFFDIKEHGVDVENLYEDYSIKYSEAIASFTFRKKSSYWSR